MSNKLIAQAGSFHSQGDLKLFSNEELRKMRKAIHKRPLDPASEILQREVRKQDALVRASISSSRQRVKSKDSNWNNCSNNDHTTDRIEQLFPGSQRVFTSQKQQQQQLLLHPSVGLSIQTPQQQISMLQMKNGLVVQRSASTSQYGKKFRSTERQAREDDLEIKSFKNLKSRVVLTSRGAPSLEWMAFMRSQQQQQIVEQAGQNDVDGEADSDQIAKKRSSGSVKARENISNASRRTNSVYIERKKEGTGDNNDNTKNSSSPVRQLHRIPSGITQTTENHKNMDISNHRKTASSCKEIDLKEEEQLPIEQAQQTAQQGQQSSPQDFVQIKQNPLKPQYFDVTARPTSAIVQHQRAKAEEQEPKTMINIFSNKNLNSLLLCSKDQHAGESMKQSEYTHKQQLVDEAIHKKFTQAKLFKSSYLPDERDKHIGNNMDINNNGGRQLHIHLHNNNVNHNTNNNNSLWQLVQSQDCGQHGSLSQKTLLVMAMQQQQQSPLRTKMQSELADGSSSSLKVSPSGVTPAKKRSVQSYFSQAKNNSHISSSAHQSSNFQPFFKSQHDEASIMYTSLVQQQQSPHQQLESPQTVAFSNPLLQNHRELSNNSQEPSSLSQQFPSQTTHSQIQSIPPPSSTFSKLYIPLESKAIKEIIEKHDFGHNSTVSPVTSILAVSSYRNMNITATPINYGKQSQYSQQQHISQIGLEQQQHQQMYQSLQQQQNTPTTSIHNYPMKQTSSLPVSPLKSKRSKRTGTGSFSQAFINKYGLPSPYGNRVESFSQSQQNMSQFSQNVAKSLAALPRQRKSQENNNINSSSCVGCSSSVRIQSNLELGAELKRHLYPSESRHKALAKEQEATLLDKYKYMVESEKLTNLNIKKERLKQLGVTHKLPKKMFDEQGLVYGRNPFLKYKPQKLSRIRLALRNYLRKMSRLGLNIFEIVEKKIFPKKAYERPGSYQFLRLCSDGRADEVKNMLARNPHHVHDFNELNQTGLHLAAFNDRSDLCLTLLALFADPDLSDSTGKTPLYYALKNSNHLIVRQLFFHRASPWSKVNLKYSEIPMDNEMSDIFTTARIVHFLLCLPFHFNDSIWQVFQTGLKTANESAEELNQQEEEHNSDEIINNINKDESDCDSEGAEELDGDVDGIVYDNN